MKMKRVACLIFCLTMLVATFAGCGPTSQSSGSTTAPPMADSNSATDASSNAGATGRTEPLVLRLGSVGSDSEYDELGYACHPFVEAVEKESGGTLKVQYYPNGELGGEDSMLEQVMTGTLDFACISGTILTTVWSDFNVYTMPFAYNDLDSFWEIDKKGAFDYFEEMTRADNKGAIWMGSFACTFRGFNNARRPVRTASDMQGLKTRVLPGELFIDIFRSLGTTTANVAFAELYTALQQGVVEADDMGIVTTYDRKLYEIEKYHTEFNMIPNVNAMMISADTLAKLTDEEIEIIRKAIDTAEESHHAGVTRLVSEVADVLRNEGVDVIMRNDLTDEEIQTFKDATQPVWDKYAPAINSEYYEQYMKIRAEVQG